MTPTAGGHPGLRRFAPVAVLGAAALAVYAPSLGNGFVWDDHEVIVSNPLTRHLSSLPVVLSSVDEVVPYYRPLTRASYLLDYQVFGMNPAGFHAVSLAVHLAAVLAMYWLAALLFQSRAPAFVAALLLAVHPLNAEAVDFIAGRNNLLATLFALLSSAMLVAATRRGSPWLAIASGVAFLFGLGSKETAFAAFPFLLGWVLVAKVRGEPRLARWSFLAPHLVALGTYAVARTLVLRSVPPSIAHREPAGLAVRLASTAYAVPRYFELAFFPRDLAIFHTVPVGRPALVAAVWLGLAVVVALVLARPSAGAVAGLCWLGLNLIPLANILPVPTTSLVAERYFYAPGVGLWLLVADGARRLADRVGWRPVGAGIALVAIGLGLRTIGRTREWRDDLSLAGSAVRAEPRSPEAHFNLGTMLQIGGDLDAARAEWEEALNLDPHDALAITAVAAADAVKGDLASAEAGLRRALALDPRIAIAHYDLARICDRTGRPQEAVAEYEAFLRYTRVRAEANFAARAQARLTALGAGTRGGSGPAR